MKQAFLNNLDFIYLFYGSAFFFLGAACLILSFRERSKKHLPWLALGLFGFTHGINEWFDMLAVSFMDKGFLSVERSVLLALSYIFLFEFSRRSFYIIRKVRISVWAYLIFLPLFLLGHIQATCPLCIEASIRYFLGFPAALCVFFVVRLYGKREGSGGCGEPFFCYAAYLFLVYAAFTGLIVPKSHLFLSHLLNNGSFFSIMNVPVQFVRGILVTIIAFSFLYKSAKLTISVRGSEKGSSLVRHILMSLLVLYVSFLFFGFRFVSAVSRHEHAHLDKLIRADAKLLKGALGRSDFDSFVSARKNILYYTQFRQLHDRLTKLAEISTFTKNLYIVTLEDGHPNFTVGSQAQVFPRSFVPAFGGVPVTYISDAFHSNRTTISQEYRDQEGYPTFSIFVPLQNLKGEVVALLGIDLNGKRLQAEVSRIRLFAIFVIMAFLVLLIVGYAFLIAFALRSIELEVQKENLDKALARLKETQRELARSEETFRGILNNSPNPIFGFDRDLKLIFWNHGAEGVYGYKKDEVIDDKNPVLNRRITELFGIETYEPRLAEIFSGESLQLEALHKTKNGNIDVAMTLFPVKDPLGHILFAIGLIQDISEHKRYEEKLAAAHVQLKQVLDAATKSAIVALDLKGVVKVFNSGAERIFGVSAAEVVNKANFARFHLNSDIEAYSKEARRELGVPLSGIQAIVAMVKKHGIDEREWTGVRWNGEHFPALLTVNPIKDGRGELIGLMGIGLDLTQRKSTEKAFLESQQKYKELVENLNVGVYTNTPGPEGEFLEVNPALVEMFEAGSAAEIMKSSASDIYQNPADRKEYSDKISRQGHVKNEELRLKTLKGRPFWASVTAIKKQNEKGDVYFYGIMQDITERKLMEIRISGERDRLQKIAASIGAGISLVNNKFEIVWVNDMVEKWFGKLESMEGKKCYKAYLSTNSICEACPTAMTMHSGQMHSSERRVALPDGRVMDFLIISSPIMNEKGELEQVLELLLDITERKRIMELLEYERALSRNVIDSIGEDLMILDCHRRTIVDVNRQFLARLNLKKEDVVGKSCQELSSHFCPPCEACEIDEVANEGRVITTMHVHKMQDGSNIYADVTLSPLKDEKGNIIGIIHLSKDVTERKRLEEELRHYSESLESLVKERTRALQTSELMFRKLFESAQDGILIIEFEGGKILDANPYLLNLLECTRDDIQGFDYMTLPFLIESKIFEQSHQELRQRVSIYFDDATIKTYTGKDMAVEVRASLYFVEEKKIIQFNIRDLTERKKMEKVKTEFVSMVSHELRTPLSAIKEGVEIVADGTQGKLNKSQIECLGIALSNIKRLNRLIGDILDISKIQSNLLRVNFGPCNVYEIIDNVYNLARIEIEKRGMVFVTDMGKGLPLVYADKDRLIQILINLLNNAVKFTREHSKITLVCRSSGDFVEFGIKDEGAGISPEELSRLFGKFVQLDSTLIRRVGGTGLGLYISRNLVEAMGGRIWAESELGVGSVFKFNVPVYKEKG
ncbi:MAG TPA: hypothetical protein DCL35_04060 [Candidatus Omnitrophica bacterium]|nr:hypothetical protein [Candidatus Omnitrophota bacterium]